MAGAAGTNAGQTSQNAFSKSLFDAVHIYNISNIFASAECIRLPASSKNGACVRLKGLTGRKMLIALSITSSCRNLAIRRFSFVALFAINTRTIASLAIRIARCASSSSAFALRIAGVSATKRGLGLPCRAAERVPALVNCEIEGITLAKS